MRILDGIVVCGIWMEKLCANSGQMWRADCVILVCGIQNGKAACELWLESRRESFERKRFVRMLDGIAVCEF